MTELINSDKKFSSLYLVEQINMFRKSEGVKAKLLHKNFLIKIEDEFDEEIHELKIQPMQIQVKIGNGAKRDSKIYNLDFKQSIQILLGESKSVRKRIIEVLEKQQAEIERLKNPQTEYQQLSQHTHRPKQIESAKSANSFAFLKMGGKQDAIDWNRKVSFTMTGKLPSELIQFAKDKKIPSKFRTSGKEVVRYYRPEVASAISLADWLHSKGENDEMALSIGKQAIPVISAILKYETPKQIAP